MPYQWEGDRVLGSLKDRGWRIVSAPAAAVVLLLAASGCGGGEDRASNLRPPSPVNVAVQIGEDAVSASPRTIGAGPILLVASNQTNASRQLTIEGTRLRQSVGPINPRDTARLKLTLQPGSVTISADGEAGLEPATVQVGPKRPSGQNELLQP